MTRRTLPHPSRLDVALGLRMLVRHPALTLIGGLGMAVGIAISVGFFSFTKAYIYPDLGLPGGDRIVALENRDLVVNNEDRQALHDFFTWRAELKTIEDVAAARFTRSNLITGGGTPELVSVAEMTAGAFDVTRVPPLLGRYLVPEDERPGAPQVVVIGYDAWQTRFNGATDVIGREVRLGSVVHTIVGVMPEAYRFPQSHQFWTPLRAQPSDFERREGPSIFIFGRLAPGVAMEQAQAELEAIGERTSAEFPLTHAQIRPMVMPYAHSLGDVQGITFWPVLQMNLMMSLLLVVIALNVAVLVYARTAARHGEIAVRSALGASRTRVVLQLFVEAFVLAALAAAAGLALAQFGIGLGERIMEGEFGSDQPFWMDFSVQPLTVLYTIGLAVFAAVLIGALPALQVTGKRLQTDLRQLGSGANLRLGRTWTLLIIAQVAIAIAALPAALAMGWDAIRQAATEPTYAAEEFLFATVAPATVETDDATAPTYDDAFPQKLTALMRLLDAEPSVAGATYVSDRDGREGWIRVENLPAPTESPAGHQVDARGIMPGYFELLGARVLSGRGLEARDAAENATAVVVNEAFVRQVLGGGNALGRRIRHVSEEERREAGEIRPPQWYEIVGVVQDLERNPAAPERVWPMVAYAVAPEHAEYAGLHVRLRGTTPAAFAPRLRELTAQIDPTLRLGTVRSLADQNRQERLAAQLVGLAVSLVLLVVLLLSAAGIYALMSFTVTQRRREIGIRSALGAEPMQVLRSIFARAATQVGAGVLLGVTLGALAEFMSGGELMGGNAPILLPVLALLMGITGVLAALGPARRGLSVQPTEALRSEA